MFKKLLTAIAIVGVLAVVRPPVAAAQITIGPLITELVPVTPGPIVAQNNGLACLGQLQGAAAIAQNPMIALVTVLGRIGVAISQIVGTPCLAQYNGRYVWEIWVNTGGGPVRRVIDALTGNQVQAP